MVLNLQLARALVLLIATCIAPSLANAHPGHAHSAPAAHDPAVAADVAAAPTAVVQGDVGQAMETVTIPTEVVSAAPSTRDRLPSGCAGHCCGSLAGMTCCCAALVPELSATPAFSRSHPFLLLRADTLFGLPPEALPKPPKSFA